MGALVHLYATILTYCGAGAELFEDLVKIFEGEEARLPEWDHLKDYGRQHNLLEMRTCGYEYVVVSPNAERAWCYDCLAQIGETLGRDVGPWREKAACIRQSLRQRLWDPALGWFRCLHPGNHTEAVYSIQIFDALRAGACDGAMAQALAGQVREGAFLGKYGVSSVSPEDTLHYELNDPDWSGGGAYSGDGPELAETLWRAGYASLAWDVLRRHFWMGAHLLYYPQEHYCDIPGVPAHKRANVIAGVAGLHAVLFGLAGFLPGLDGSLEIDPQPLGLEAAGGSTGRVEIRGFKFRGKEIDLFMKPGHVTVLLNGALAYEGPPKRVRLA
jgi:hypothetical protein